MIMAATVAAEAEGKRHRTPHDVMTVDWTETDEREWNMIRVRLE